jgi:hypothetical protein
MITLDNKELTNLFEVKDGKGLLFFINAAGPRADDILAHGAIVREKHQQGNSNRSKEATSEGAGQALEDILKPKPFFGNRIKWAIRTWKNYFRE